MKNPFRSLSQLQRDLGSVAVEVSQVQFYRFAVPRDWEPAINVFLCGNQFVVCVELAGVDKESIHVGAEARRLMVRGSRAVAEPACDDPPAVQVLALEIDHGPFERIVELPADVDAERVTAEQRNGLLWIRLPIRSHG